MAGAAAVFELERRAGLVQELVGDAACAGEARLRAAGAPSWAARLARTRMRDDPNDV
jgi:hypothetical protein